jgi:glycosyltransferase involved in cell wall biosynthesis
MKIAVLAPLVRPVHPDTRGSRPRLVYDLARFLTKNGHEVTVFASGDSEVDGELIKICPKAIYSMPLAENPFYQHTIYIAKMINILLEKQANFDIIHNHAYPEFLPLLVSPLLTIPIVSTIHLPITEPITEFYQKYPKAYFTSVSDNQRLNIEGVNFIGTVYNGVDKKEFPFKRADGDYFLFFGRMGGSDPKGLKTAIKVIKELNQKLKIAGNVESQEYFDTEIKPSLNKNIQFVGPVDSVGPIGFKEKINLYQNAKALLFPIAWPEPFGMTMIEAMACGTPVVAFDMGAVREVIEDGVTGFICPPGDVEAMTKAVQKIYEMPEAEYQEMRKACRKRVEENFTTQKMVSGYEKVYKKVIDDWSAKK